MRLLALILPLALLASGCKPPIPKKPWAATQPKDRRVEYAGVSVLIPAGVAWWKPRNQPGMSATWGEHLEPWCDVTEIPASVTKPRADRKIAERLWKQYYPRIKTAEPGVRIPPATWMMRGKSPFLNTRFVSKAGIDTRGGFLQIGDRLVMVIYQIPKSSPKIDPAALPALERLVDSIEPLEETDRYK